jgi:hypothetical protein
MPTAGFTAGSTTAWSTRRVQQKALSVGCHNVAIPPRLADHRAAAWKDAAGKRKPLQNRISTGSDSQNRARVWVLRRRVLYTGVGV